MLKVGTARAFLIMGGAAFGLVVCELALRAVGFSSPVFFRSDVDTGYSLREGAEGWWRSEGEAYVTINSSGLRDREHSKSKPPGAFRIAVLGDSYAEAMQVPMEAAFWRVLELKLQACRAFDGRQVEVINFGVGGYGTAQEILALRHRAWAYSPDLVLLAFLSGNDVRNNVRSLEGDPMRPYFVYKDDALVLDTSFSEPSRFSFPTVDHEEWRVLAVRSLADTPIPPGGQALHQGGRVDNDAAGRIASRSQRRASMSRCISSRSIRCGRRHGG